eukprot:371676_1
MLQSTNNTTKKLSNLPCHIANLSYLKAQRNFNYIWFGLCWRDIFRLVILCIILDKLIANISRPTVVVLCLPYLFGCVLFVLGNVSQRKQMFKEYLQTNGDTSTIAEESFYLFGSILFSIISIGILPSTSYYSMHWGQDYGDVSRLFAEKDKAKPYTTPLLKYILNNTSDVRKRMVVVNYYLTIAFANCIPEKRVKSLNYFAIKHNGKNGLSNVNYTDIQHAAGYVPYCTKARWFRCIVVMFIVLYDISITTIMTAQQPPVVSVEYMVLWIYVVMDGLWVLFDLKYGQLYWFCHHMLPFVDLRYAISDCPWDECSSFDSPESMMQYIKILYHIMFESVENHTILNYSHCIPPEIANIIAGYLWLPLPLFDATRKPNHDEGYNEDSDHDEGSDFVYKQRKMCEFQVQFRLMLGAFKDNIDSVNG